MKTRVIFENLNVSESEFNVIKSDLEKIIKIDPSNEIKRNSKIFKEDIDEKEIVVRNSTKINYLVKFFYRDKEDKEQGYLGSMKYNSPIN